MKTILTADSGSTKTDWHLTDNDNINVKLHTQGLNPILMTEEKIKGIIHDELIPCLAEYGGTENIREVHFYGAGCTPVKIPSMESVLKGIFTRTETIEVASDLLGAAKALCGKNEGIACILGTGANSCLYDGEKIVENVSPMGFILGDEGSGAVIGKTFINELYKGKHRDFIEVFESQTGLTPSDIIQRVYRESMPNRFLASLSLFINRHKDEQKWISDMLIRCFCEFFRKNISHYERPDLEVNFVGSVAFYYQDELKKAANLEGFKIGCIIKSPLG